MPSALISLLLAAASIAASRPEPYAAPPPRGTSERLAWNAIRGVRGADAAIERWLARNPNAPIAKRALLAHLLCTDYGRTIVGPRLIAACALDAQLDPSGDASSLAVATILRGAPALTVSGSATVPMTLSPRLRARSIPATANSVTIPWFIDVGAGMSTMTDSDAKRLGVRMLGGSVPVVTATSIRPVARIGMIDRMTIGGATIANMPVVVMPDAALTFDGSAASPILGLPALVAFDRIAWLDNGTRMAIGRDAPALAANARTMRFFWHEDGVGIPIELGRGIIDADFDSGAGDSTLYLPGFAMLSEDQRQAAVVRDVQIGGAGGFENYRLKTLDRFDFTIGGVPITVRRANVEERSDLGAARIGNDMIDQLQSLVMDFATMTLSVEPKR